MWCVLNFVFLLSNFWTTTVTAAICICSRDWRSPRSIQRSILHSIHKQIEALSLLMAQILLPLLTSLGPVRVALDLSYLRVLVQLMIVLFLLHSLKRDVALISRPVQETTLWSADIFCVFYFYYWRYISLCLQIQENRRHYTQAGIIFALLRLIASP